jgi:hypothetical protein
MVVCVLCARVCVVNVGVWISTKTAECMAAENKTTVYNVYAIPSNH